MEKKDSLAAVGILTVGAPLPQGIRHATRFVFLVQREITRAKHGEILLPGTAARDTLPDRTRQILSPIVGQIESAIDGGLAKVGIARPGFLPAGFLSVGLYRRHLAATESQTEANLRIEQSVRALRDALREAGIFSASARRDETISLEPRAENQIDLEEAPCLQAFSVLCQIAMESALKPSAASIALAFPAAVAPDDLRRKSERSPALR